MRRQVLLVVTAAGLTVAGAALAAAPTRGGTYIGTNSTFVQKQLVLRVSKNGRTAYASLRCAGTLASTMSNVAIRNGSFHATKRTGSVVIWTLNGRFLSKTTATASAFLHAVCDGGNVHWTLKLLP
jgi:hypothetical protein